MKQFFMYLSMVSILLVLNGQALLLFDFMLHQFVYISIFIGGIVYLGRCFRRACIDK